MKKAYKIMVLIVVMISLLSIPVSASETQDTKIDIVEPRFTYIHVFTNYFDISSSGKATFTSFLAAHDVDQVKITAKLQRYKDGKWSTIKSWSKTENGIDCGLSGNWYVVSGYSYRLVTYGYTYKGSTIVEYTTYVSDVENYFK